MGRSYPDDARIERATASWMTGVPRSTPTRRSQEAAEFEERGFPLDVIGLEPGWHDHADPCSFAWDPALSTSRA